MSEEGFVDLRTHSHPGNSHSCGQAYPDPSPNSRRPVGQTAFSLGLDSDPLQTEKLRPSDRIVMGSFTPDRDCMMR